MPAIITDQYRILNAETFVDSFVGIGTTGNNNYYTFLAHPKPENTQVKNYGFADWGSPVPAPVDSFAQENFYHDSMLFLKKVTADDVRRVIPRINWQSGTVYDMYRNNYSGENQYVDKNLTPQTRSTSLYGSTFYVVTSEFRVYLCINNGSNPDNSDGQKSTTEPTHTNTAPQPSGGTDGYIWKYLYTISPSDIVKFVTSKYIPLPQKWGDATNENIKNAAVDGEIQTIILKREGAGVGVGTFRTIDNPGVGPSSVFIPSQAIFIPNHGLRTGDEVTYQTDGTPFKVKFDANVAQADVTLFEDSPLFIAKFDENFIGLSTVKIGIGSTGTFVGIGSTLQSKVVGGVGLGTVSKIDLTYFLTSGSGDIHSLKTNF